MVLSNTNYLDAINTAVIFTASLIAIWLGLRKTRTKVLAIYTLNTHRLIGTRIKDVTLYNMKDNHVAVWGLYAVINREICIPIYSPPTPLIINPYDAIKIEADEYSELRLEDGAYDPEHTRHLIEISINTGRKIKTCRPLNKPDPRKLYRVASKFKYNLDDVLVTEHIEYIFKYILEGEERTALISGGFISGDWTFTPNHLGGANSDKALEAFMHKFDQIFSNYTCFKVKYPDTYELFRKKPDQPSRKVNDS